MFNPGLALPVLGQPDPAFSEFFPNKIIWDVFYISFGTVMITFLILCLVSFSGSLIQGT